MDLDRALESLKAAEMCLEHELVNSAASRAYYAMFQAAQAAMEAARFERTRWTHAGLQGAFTAELIYRRKLYPAVLRDYLSSGLEVRQEADYGDSGVSKKIAGRLVRRAASFVSRVQEVTRHGTTSQR